MTDPKTDVWMPLWIGAYLADTMKLTTVQHGAYFLLLMAYWRERAPLKDDDDELRSITKTERAEWRRMRPVLSPFFKVGEGVWWHKRVEEEMSKADNRSKAAKEKAQKGADARWKDKDKDASSDAPSIPQAKPDDVPRQCPPPSPSSLRSENLDPTGLVASADADAPANTVVKMPDRRIPCPADRLLEAFHTECPTLPRVMKLNDKRKSHLTARWREVDADSKFQSSDDGIEIFTGIFKRVNASDFLSGRAKDWHATFDWLTDSSTNFLKVCEGHYDNDRRAKK